MKTRANKTVKLLQLLEATHLWHKVQCGRMPWYWPGIKPIYSLAEPRFWQIPLVARFFLHTICLKEKIQQKNYFTRQIWLMYMVGFLFPNTVVVLLTFVLNAGDSGLKSRLSWLLGSMISLSPSKRALLLYLKVGHDLSIPHHLQFTVCFTIILPLDVVGLLSSQLKALLNTPRWS
jgi:hypothetical protein